MLQLSRADADNPVTMGGNKCLPPSFQASLSQAHYSSALPPPPPPPPPPPFRAQVDPGEQVSPVSPPCRLGVEIQGPVAVWLLVIGLGLMGT